MSLYCADGRIAVIPLATKADPNDRCKLCRETAVFHHPDPPCITDELDRAIYAAGFVAAMQMGRTLSVEDHRANASDVAEEMVRAHRLARSGR